MTALLGVDSVVEVEAHHYSIGIVEIEDKDSCEIEQGFTNDCAVEILEEAPVEVEVEIPGLRMVIGGAEAFTYQMPTSQTTALVTHTLGRDPVAVQVFDEFGVLCDGYGVTFTDPAHQVRLSFDVALKALIRLL